MNAEREDELRQTLTITRGRCPAPILFRQHTAVAAANGVRKFSIPDLNGVRKFAIGIRCSTGDGVFAQEKPWAARGKTGDREKERERDFSDALSTLAIRPMLLGYSRWSCNFLKRTRKPCVRIARVCRYFVHLSQCGSRSCFLARTTKSGKIADRCWPK